MINLDEDALICDLAETYHIYDYRSLPLRTVATLSAGLRDDSRIRMAAAGVPASQDTLLLAAIADRIELFRYGFSENAKSGKELPVSLVETLCGRTRTNMRGVSSFATAEDFEKALARIRGE